jgi:hypothetical protein
MKYEIQYGITDLALEAPFDLTPLADALAHRGLLTYHVLHHEDGSWAARFQAEREEEVIEPDQDINAMLTAIESLDEPSRNSWAACTLREFDIAYYCGEVPEQFIQQLTAATIARMAAAGASIMITLYPLIDTAPIDAAVEILKKDKSVKSYIGKFSGHGHDQVDWPSLKRDVAEVRVTLSGNKGSVSVLCRMELNNQEEWKLKEIIKKEELLHSCKPIQK